MATLLSFHLFMFSREAVLQQTGLSPDIIYEAAARLGDRAVYGSGTFLVVNFVSRPLNALILYFVYEGVIRAMAA